MQLIPAIDLRHGKVVRLSQGDDRRRTEYEPTPADMIGRFANAGVARVHVVDLDAAFGEAPQRSLIEGLTQLATERGTKVELGGGLRNEEAVAWAVEAGCDRLVLGSMVVKEFDRFVALVERHPNRLVPAVETAGGLVKISGWTESAALSLGQLCSNLNGLACAAVLVTDVDRDGEMVGPNLELAERVARDTGIPAILSGGVTELADLEKAAQSSLLDGVIVGKALYEGRFTLDQAMAVLAEEKSPGATP